MEIPNIIAQHNFSAESSIPEVSLPTEPSVSDVSSIVPPGEPSEVPPITETPLLGSEIPQMPAEPHEESQMPSTSAQEDAAAMQTSDMPQMENMGYDQVSLENSHSMEMHEKCRISLYILLSLFSYVIALQLLLLRTLNLGKFNIETFVNAARFR